MENCYNHGIIYKLCCKDLTIKDVYVGSTCAFRMRKAAHKSDCNNENSKKYNRNVYKFIRDHGGWDNWDMIEIKKVNCETKRELEKEERAVLEMLGGTLNSIVPTRSHKEWAEANNTKRTKYKTEWYESNKERIIQKKKMKYHANKDAINEKAKTEMIKCECGSTIRKDGKIEHLKSLKHQKHLKSIC